MGSKPSALSEEVNCDSWKEKGSCFLYTLEVVLWYQNCHWHSLEYISQVACILDGWNKCWEEGLTPWDLGQPTPILQQLHQIGNIPKGRALVPGCGSVSSTIFTNQKNKKKFYHLWQKVLFKRFKFGSGFFFFLGGFSVLSWTSYSWQHVAGLRCGIHCLSWAFRCWTRPIRDCLKESSAGSDTCFKEWVYVTLIVSLYLISSLNNCLSHAWKSVVGKLNL